MGVAERALDRHPVGIAVQSVEFLPGIELAVFIDGPYEGRGGRLRIGERPSLVGEHSPGADVFELVVGRLEHNILCFFDYNWMQSQVK